MPNPNISALLTPADITNIQTNKVAILAILVFLVNLTPAQRKKLRKMATKRTGYVNDVYSASINNPTAIPGTFDMAEYTKDFDLMTALKQVRNILSPLIEGVDDTILLLGNELMSQSDQCYSFLQTAAKGNPALTTIVEQIATAFARVMAAEEILSIPMGGSATISKLDTSKAIINSGSTILTYYKVGELPSTAQTLNPAGSVKVPKDFRNIVVRNQSTTEDGEITFKLKP